MDEPAATPDGFSTTTLSLDEALAREGISLEPAQREWVERYCRLLWNWNEKLNLTRHTDYSRFVSRDLVDTRAIAAELAEGDRVLDVGSGGGVPGIPLAILRRDLHVTLSESVAKKARVLDEIVAGLGLPLAVHHGRAEDLLARGKYDALVIRAVASIEKLLGWFKPHWASIGRLLIIKGPRWADERHEARERGLLKNLELRRKSSWSLPGTDSESVLLEIRPKAASA